MKKIISLFFFICISFSQKYNHFEGNVSYYGSHPLHDWKGMSTSINGEIIFEAISKNYRCLIEVPVESFKSKNGNRDSNMLIYANALEHPKILFKSTNINIESGFAKITGMMEFAGKEKEIISNAKVEINDEIIVEGDFIINLSDFDIKRPSLMFLKIDDQIKIEYKMNVKNKK